MSRTRNGVAAAPRLAPTVALSAALAAASHGGLAQTAPSSIELPPVTITTTRLPTALADAPGSVVVVPAGQIAPRILPSADRALQLSPGIFVTEPRGTIQDTTFSNIVIRGIPEQKRTLFMIDGVPINNPFLGRFFAGSADDLDHVEVLKGAASALWGGNALGGVVNNITRQPEGREFTSSIGYGSNLGSDRGIQDRRMGYVSYADRLFEGKVSVFASVSYGASRNYPTDLVTSTAVPPASITGARPTRSVTGGPAFLLGDKGNLMSEDYSATLKITVDPTENNRVRFSYFRTHLNYDFSSPNTLLRSSTTGAAAFAYGTSVTPLTFLATPETLVQDIYTLSYEHRFGDTQMKVTASVVNRSPENGYITPGTGATSGSGVGVISNSPSMSYRTDIQVVQPAFERHTFTVGGTFQYDTVDFTDRGLSNWRNPASISSFVDETRGADRMFSVFAQDKIQILPSLAVYLGLHADLFTTFDGRYTNTTSTTAYPSRDASAVSPKGAIVWRPTDGLTARASVGTGFRPPNVFELYTTTKAGIFTFLPNPALKPETAVTWHAGLEYAFQTGTKVSATYFGSSVDDLIYNRSTGTTFALINAGHADIQGFELTGETPVPWVAGVTAFANYTFTDAHIAENTAVPASVGKQLVRVPRHTVNFGAQWQRDAFSAAVFGRFAGKRYANDTNNDRAQGVFGALDPYVVTDLSFGYKVTENFSAQFLIGNLFDYRYFDSRAGTGRSWFLRTTARF